LSQFFLYASQYRPENSGHRDREAGEKETKRRPSTLFPDSSPEKGDNDCRFTGMIQRRHDPARTVTSFILTELPFNGDSVEFILMGQFFKGFDFVLVFQLVFSFP
jgi:hypothetical protein